MSFVLNKLLLPVLLAPMVRLANPLTAARVLTLAFTLLGALAVGALIRGGEPDPPRLSASTSNTAT